MSGLPASILRWFLSRFASHKCDFSARKDDLLILPGGTIVSSVILVAVLLPILAIAGLIIGLSVLSPILSALFTTLQELARAHPPLAFAALIASVAFMLLTVSGNRN